LSEERDRKPYEYIRDGGQWDVGKNWVELLIWKLWMRNVEFLSSKFITFLS